MRRYRKQRIQYLYPYGVGKIMVGHIKGGVSQDWYYLTRWQSLKYLLTGRLPKKEAEDD